MSKKDQGGTSKNDYSTLKAGDQVPKPYVGTKRGEVLTTANSYVNGDRNVQYGSPSADFNRTAEFWNTYLDGVLHRKLAGRDVPPEIQMVLDNLIESWDIAAMMQLLKLSRLTWSPQKDDHWIDIAGYAACGAECVSDHMGEQ